MALEPLVYYRVELSDSAFSSTLLEDGAKGFSVIEALRPRFSPPTTSTPYRLNLVALLYAIGKRIPATAKETEKGNLPHGSYEHLMAFFQYHAEEGWNEDSCAIHWEIADIVDFVGTIRKYDGTKQEMAYLETVTTKGVPLFYRGFTLLYDTNDRWEPFFERFRKFFADFHHVLGLVCQRYHINFTSSYPHPRFKPHA